MKLDGEIKLRNVFTGEVETLEYKNIEDVVNIYEELNTNAKAIKRATERLKQVLEEYLGQDEELELDNGYTLKRVARTMREYRMEDIKKYLDEDQLSVVTKPDVRALKSVIQEMVDRGELPTGAWKDIEDNAYVKPTKPYIRLMRS